MMVRSLVLTLVTCGVLISCGGGVRGGYDQGYNDGYDGTTPKVRTGDYWRGYQEGGFDAQCDYLVDQRNFRECRNQGCYKCDE